MLLQSSQTHKTGSPAKVKAYQAVKSLAHKHHSLRMAALAAMIQTATEGHFDMVVTEVDKMLAELRQEEMDDITLRDYCQAEEVKVEGEIEDLVHEMDTIQGLIDRLNAKKKETQADIKQTESDIQATEDAMAEALSNRNSENEDFKAALKDDIDAVALLASAIDAMTAFYKNNKLPLGLVQKKGKAPEYSGRSRPRATSRPPRTRWPRHFPTGTVRTRTSRRRSRTTSMQWRSSRRPSTL